MGSVAFALFGGELDHAREKWMLDDRRYEVALRAVSPLRAQRFASLKELQAAWREEL